MQKIFAVTFKDEQGKYTVQDTDNFSLAYDYSLPPVIDPYGDFAMRLAQTYGGEDTVAKLVELRASLREKAVQAMLLRGFGSREEAELRINRDPYYINWYAPFPSLAELLPADAFKMLPWRDANWRENARYYVENSPLPWPYDAIEDHYAHLELQEDAATGQKISMVRFFASPEHGEVRRATSMKPGKYLTKYYPAIPADEVRDWATRIDAAGEVRFAVTADDIVKVYTQGPRSCMAYELERYESPVHPVSVYGDSDLQLAYLSYVDLSAPNFRASARVLVWPERKIYGRIYGDEHRLVPALEKLGYRSGSLKGAKIKRIDYDDYLVLPYIDGCCSVTVHDDYIVIGGSQAADSTSGLVYQEDNRAYCNGYEDYVNDDPEDFVYVRGVGDVSPSYAREECFMCAYYEQYYHNDDMVLMANGDTWSERAFDRYGASCERTHECYPLDELVRLADTDELVSRDWAENNAHLSDDGEFYAEAPQAEEEAQAA